MIKVTMYLEDLIDDISGMDLYHAVQELGWHVAKSPDGAVVKMKVVPNHNLKVIVGGDNPAMDALVK